jgi:hypothetical protein
MERSEDSMSLSSGHCPEGFIGRLMTLASNAFSFMLREAEDIRTRTFNMESIRISRSNKSTLSRSEFDKLGSAGFEYWSRSDDKVRPHGDCDAFRSCLSDDVSSHATASYWSTTVRGSKSASYKYCK